MTADPPTDEPTPESDDDFVRAMEEHTMRLFGREGWDDPAMEIYNDLDPRLPPNSP